VAELAVGRAERVAEPVAAEEQAGMVEAPAEPGALAVAAEEQGGMVEAPAEPAVAAEVREGAEERAEPAVAAEGVEEGLRRVHRWRRLLMQITTTIP